MERIKHRTSPWTAKKEQLTNHWCCNRCTFAASPTWRSFPPTGKRKILHVIYQCEGEGYENFTTMLHEFVRSNPHNSTTWGRREYPLPANKSVIAFGNSHLRQHITSMICQYESKVSYFRARGQKENDLYVKFNNNASIHAVINSPVEVSKNWTQRLETSFAHRPLSGFDGFLLVQFNSNLGDLPDIVNTTFYKNMMNWSQTDPDLNFENVSPPNLLDVASVFPTGRPIVLWCRQTTRTGGKDCSTHSRLDDTKQGYSISSNHESKVHSTVEWYWMWNGSKQWWNMYHQREK